MRKLTLVCAILGLSMGFVACSDDDNSSSSDKVAVGGKCKVAAECQSNVCENGVCVAKATDADACKDKNEGDVCDKDSKKTCQKENDKLVCKDKPADADACKDKNEGDVCDKDSKKTCQKENDKLVCKDKPADAADACKDKNEGDVCDKDGNKTCQKENDKLVCKDKPAGSDTDACKDKNEGDVCDKDSKKTCQKENDKLVCKDKPADADACKDKNEGDKCGEGMICDAQKKCVADLRECLKDEDCSAAFPKCDTEANLCYKVNADYQINCSNAGDKKTAYMAEWIYKDDSKESKIISEECTGEKSDCKEGVGCAVPTTAQERECYYQEDCQDKGERTLCGPDYMCIKPECSTESPCTDNTKQCQDGLCVPKSA